MPVQTFCVEDSGKLGADTFDVEQHRDWCRRVRPLLGHECVTLCLHRLDLSEQQFESVELTTDLGLQMLRQPPAIAGPQFFQPLAPVTALRLVAGDVLTEEQSFDAVDVKCSFTDQRLALAANTTPILIFGGRHLDH